MKKNFVIKEFRTYNNRDRFEKTTTKTGTYMQVYKEVLKIYDFEKSRMETEGYENVFYDNVRNVCLVLGIDDKEHKNESFLIYFKEEGEL